jgi:hypothetical protein
VVPRAQITEHRHRHAQPKLGGAHKSPLKKGKAAGLGGCLGRFVIRRCDNPRAVSPKPLSPFVKWDLCSLPSASDSLTGLALVLTIHPKRFLGGV